MDVRGVLALLAPIAVALGAAEAGAAVNVYSSLPRQGTSRAQTLAVERGARMALRERGGSAGGVEVNYIPLDDSTRANPGTADEAQTARNANRVAADPYAVAYIGEFNSGGTQVSLPILNRAGMLQVSPSNTYIGLTSGGPGTEPGEPGRYRPTGRRTYARIVPHDGVQAAALATLARHARCRSAYLVSDGSVYGEGIVARAGTAGRRIGLRLAGRVTFPRAASRRLRSLARRVRAPCVIYGGVTGNGAVAHFRALAAGRPSRRFFASDGVAESAFTHPRLGGISSRVGRRTLMTVATLGVRGFPAEGRAFFDRMRAVHGRAGLDPFGIYGYECMRIVLDAIAAASPPVRRDTVLDAFGSAGVRRGPLGSYSFDPNGDTTLRTYGVYGVSRGVVTYRRAIVAR